MSIEQFLIDWDKTSVEDQEPPPIVTVGDPARPAIYMLTDYWCQSGGPMPYADSYTYSIFADRDLGREIMAALQTASDRERWSIIPEPIETNSTSPLPSLWQLLTARLTGRSLPS